MDGVSIPGPYGCENWDAECLEFPASWNRNSIADELPESNVLAANYLTDNHQLSGKIVTMRLISLLTILDNPHILVLVFTNKQQKTQIEENSHE